MSGAIGCEHPSQIGRSKITKVGSTCDGFNFACFESHMIYTHRMQ